MVTGHKVLVRGVAGNDAFRSEEQALEENDSFIAASHCGSGGASASASKRSAEVLGARIDAELLALLFMVGREGGAAGGQPVEASSRSVVFASNAPTDEVGDARFTPWHVPSLSETAAIERLESDPWKVFGGSLELSLEGALK